MELKLRRRVVSLQSCRFRMRQPFARLEVSRQILLSNSSASATIVAPDAGCSITFPYPFDPTRLKPDEQKYSLLGYRRARSGGRCVQLPALPGTAEAERHRD